MSCPVSTPSRTRHSQALADFGIANSPKRGPTFPDQAPPSSQEKVNTSFFGGFAGADSVTLPMPSVMAAAAVTMSSESGSIGGVFDGKGTRERIGSVEVADLLRATRLRGGGVGGPRQKLRSYQPQPVSPLRSTMILVYRSVGVNILCSSPCFISRQNLHEIQCLLVRMFTYKEFGASYTKRRRTFVSIDWDEMSCCDTA